MTPKTHATCKSRFRETVYLAVQSVPAGWVTTYGDVAVAAGSPRAARQVGQALSRLHGDLALKVPWHRVINAQGRISIKGDVVRAELQRSLLEREGHIFNSSGRINLREKRWHFPAWLDQ